MFFFGFAANFFTLIFLGLMSMVFLYQGLQGVIANEPIDETKQIVLSHQECASLTEYPVFTDLELIAYTVDEPELVPVPPSLIHQETGRVHKLPVKWANPFIGRGPPAV